jgi:hypothetical protein
MTDLRPGTGQAEPLARTFAEMQFRSLLLYLSQRAEDPQNA